MVGEFRSPLTSQQKQWLRGTSARMRRISFHVDDKASAAVLHDVYTLVGDKAWHAEVRISLMHGSGAQRIARWCACKG